MVMPYQQSASASFTTLGEKNQSAFFIEFAVSFVNIIIGF
jgi:hypothetical protein